MLKFTFQSKNTFPRVTFKELLLSDYKQYSHDIIWMVSRSTYIGLHMNNMFVIGQIETLQVHHCIMIKTQFNGKVKCVLHVFEEPHFFR